MFYLTMHNFLTIHTKVRRLGYLKLLVIQYFETDFISTNVINQYFEKIAGDTSFIKQLSDYDYLYRKDGKGIIENIGTGASAEPYISLAENLSIIAKSNYSYILTKYGKVYKIILERYRKEAAKFKFIEEKRAIQNLSLFPLEADLTNIFVLNLIDKLFLLKQIFEKDFLYFKSILNIIKENQSKSPKASDKIKYSIVKQRLHQEVIKQLSQYIVSKAIDTEYRKNTLNIIKEYSEKKLKIRSYESIVEPRINWLIDLDLLDSVKHKQGYLVLSDAGVRLLNCIEDVFDVENFLENAFIRSFSITYSLSLKNDINLNKKMEKYLDFAFINFRTLAPNRITSSQAFTYISWMCLLREGVLVEYDEVKRYVFANDGKGYTIDWFPSENDGSIKKLL